MVKFVTEGEPEETVKFYLEKNDDGSIDLVAESSPKKMYILNMTTEGKIKLYEDVNIAGIQTDCDGKIKVSEC